MPHVLDKLAWRVWYCGTDSVFTLQPGEWIPPLAEYLGDLTDELNDGGVCNLPEEDHITEFVSRGPKCVCPQSEYRRNLFLKSKETKGTSISKMTVTKKVQVVYNKTQGVE